MTAYYNEKDEFAAQWLRNLIAAGHIAPGDVDERSIEDVVPVELARYTQCHFFAGIGVWSYSMRRAGWSDDTPAWTGSCPCQPFSAAGKGGGFADERHLWPAFFHLIEQCGPAIVFGEQVASADGLAWLDLVQTDMEGAEYAFAALDTCAAGFGAPHIRQRLYWMAYNESVGRAEGAADAFRLRSRNVEERVPRRPAEYGCVESSGMAYANLQQRQGGAASDHVSRGWHKEPTAAAGHDGVGVVEYANLSGQHEWPPGGQQSLRNVGHEQVSIPTGPTNGFWRAADWLFCRDDKWRPVEPGTFPLADGAPNRMGRLRGYGNAIVAPQAEEFIRMAMAYAP